MIALLSPHAVLSKPIAGRGSWGARYAAYGRPGFALVIEGQCWLTLEKSAPILLRRGDFVLLPSTPAFSLSSDPDRRCRDVEPSDRPVRHGEAEGTPDFRMFGGAFEIEAANASLVADLLPAMIIIRAGEEGAERLAHLVEQIRDECETDLPGRDMIVTRLLEVMLIECLRRDGIGEGTEPAGLLTAMRDPGLARALRAIHAEVRHGWTVAELAGRAGMSRSIFAARFQKALGCAPIEYLARWRMALARDALIRGGTPLDRLADEIGYESASAFSTAFRRRTGCAPGAFARHHRGRAADSAARA